MPRPVAALLALVLTACSATPPARLAVVTPATSVPSELAHLDLAPGTSLVVYRRSGDVVAGRLRHVSHDAVALAPVGDGAALVVPDADIERVGVLIGRSRPARAWIGFAIGAVLSLPLSLSMVGDAVLIVGGLGAWVGGATGDSRVEIRLARP